MPKPAQYMVLSALGFSLMSLFVKLSSQAGIPVMQILAARAFISLLLSYATLKAINIPVFGQNHTLLLARGFVGFLALTMVYYSVTHLPLAVATVIQFLNPIFTAILGFILLKEVMNRALIYCTVCSIAGVIIMVAPFETLQETLSTDTLSPFALIVGLGGAILSALAYIIVRKLGSTEHPLVIVFYFPLVALPASVPFFYQDFVMPNTIGFFYLLMVGCLTQVGQIYLTKAMALESAGKNMAYSYTQVLFATVFGVLFLNETPSFATIMGALLILLGAYLNIAFKPRARYSR